MKPCLILAAFLISLSIKSQTKVFPIDKSGSANKDMYQYFDHSTGKVFMCMHCKEKEEVNNVSAKIKGNKLFMATNATVNFNEKQTQMSVEKENKLIDLGYLTKDNKIIATKDGKWDEKAKTAYIKDHKVYDANDKLMGEIEGEDIYGAFWYLFITK